MERTDAGGGAPRYSYYLDGIRLRLPRHTLYIDESGNRDNAEHLVVAGILLHEDMIDGVWDRCHDIAEAHSDRPVDELKFSDMMDDGGNYPEADGCRSGPAAGILDIIRGEQMPLFATVFRKDSFGDRRFRGYDNEDHYATERVMIAALDYAATQRSKIDVVRDRCNIIRDRGITDSFDIRRVDGAGMEIRNIESYGTYRPEDSKDYKGLQFADFCAGAVARVMTWDKADCYGMIRDLLDTPLNRGVIPTFCPADGPGSPGPAFLERVGG